MTPLKIKTSQLQLADVVRMSPDTMAFSTAIVTQIKDNIITLFRPYGVTADFSYTGGVICYTGIEEYTIYSSDREVELLERKVLK